jgi:hypothetical protein
MMRPASLTPQQYDAYLDALASEAARVAARVRVLNLDTGRYEGSYGDSLLEGSVSLNRGEDIPVSASLSLVDLDDDLSELDLRYALQLHHGVDVPDMGWIWTPAGCGQVAAVSDDGDTARLEIHGLECLGLPPNQTRNRTWKKGTPVARAIKEMWEDVGITRFRIAKRLLGSDGPKLSATVHSGGPDERRAPARVMKRMARMRNLQAFFDFEGYLVVRIPPDDPAVTWHEEEGHSQGSLRAAETSAIAWSRDFAETYNVVRAQGKKKNRVTVDADDYFPKHAYAPSNIRVGNRPRRRVAEWTDDTIAREKPLREAAVGQLRRLMIEQTDVDFSSVPTFVAGPWDLARGQRRDGRWLEWWMDEAEIPLLEGEMTVGHQVLTRPGKPRRRIRPKSPNGGKGK